MAARNKARAAKQKGDVKKADHLTELSDFIIFMVHSFLRPSEWKSLQHKHVKMIEHGNNPHLELTVRGKTGLRKSITMQSAVDVYKRIIGRSGKEPNDFLFMPLYSNRKTAATRMARSFMDLLEELDIKIDANGEKRTTYSLRHSALMFRFKFGEKPDLLALAKNAGTSIDQLERFYLRRVNPGDKIANLQNISRV
ncbi:hypothetical protein [Sphingobium phenoxybenzoativorans]|uniref:hypothetical protein n=1 Tax=Sphingobium phenoxybenzoativorans TaxID=1592790 RepID=UPI000872D0DC|nr:hypothetical protein [Sphingobium phenoxybenzoativorans]